MKRKIAGCVNVRIRAGDYQHIEVVKYAEEEIEYSSVAELKEKEDALNSDLVDCMLRGLTATANKLGKGKAEAIEVEQTLSKAIPEWLANDPVPNIANGAKKILNTVADKQKAEKDKAAATEAAMLPEDDGKLIKPAKADVNPMEQLQHVKIEKPVPEDLADLFADDSSEPKPISTPIEVEVEAKTEATEATGKTKKEDDGFDIFSDSEDLFGDK